MMETARFTVRSLVLPLSFAMLIAASCAQPRAAQAAAPPGPPSTLPRDPAHPPLRLAMLVFPGVEVIDLAGPYEVFTEAMWGAGAVFDVYTVAPRAGTITTKPSWGGLPLTPDYTIANAPHPDVLVIPGGYIGGAFDDVAVQQWIRACADSARHVMSVCNGAYFLAATGLLDGQEATSAAPLIDGLKRMAPTCRLVYDRRVVDNGKIITTAGLSSGIDGALHLVERVAGREVAFTTALNLEYDWHPDGGGYVRAALADRWLRAMLGRNGFDFGGRVSEWRVVHQEGDRTTWTKAWEFRSSAPPETLMACAARTMGATWQRVEERAAAASATTAKATPAATTATTSRWSFLDADGGRWKAVAALQPPSDRAALYRFTIRLDKAGEPQREKAATGKKKRSHTRRGHAAGRRRPS